jgi:hypothetical protein
MIYKSDTGYILNMEIYTGEGKKLEAIILTVLRPYFGIWHHIYQDNYYNSVATAEVLLHNKIRVCGTIRENTGLPPSLKDAAKNLKKGERMFCHRGDILLVWKDKRDVHMISSIHDASVIFTGEKDRKIGDEIKKPFCIVQYNNYMKGGVDLADQYLSCCSTLRKTCQWEQEGRA